jgi:signal transduction histidine kinase
MSAGELIRYLTWISYIVIFIVGVAGAVRRPRRANIDIALLFSTPALIIGIGLAAALGLIQPGPIPNAINTTLVMAMGYLLLRLVDDFAAVPAWLMPGAAGLLIVLAVGAFLFAPPRPLPLTLLHALYPVVTLLYGVVAFLRAARRATGVTRRRMRAVAVGALLLGGLFLFTALNVVIRLPAGVLGVVTDLAGLASGISFLIGFAPPGILRRAWQEPELRAFLGRAALLPRLPDTESIVRELERGAATAVGASHASVGLWDEDAQVLRFGSADPPREIAPTDRFTTGRAFLTQQPVFTPKIGPTHPLYNAAQWGGAPISMMAAPITAGERRLGVLAVYAPRAPIFADEDLALVRLLADQAAVVLESRALIDAAARVQAREEATRLKEDFLSAAAHDLRTPLTTLVGQAELLERRALRAPDAPADLESLRRVKKEAHRLKTLVLELLDAARAEQGKLVGDKEELDLVEVAHDTCARHMSDRHPCTVGADEAVHGVYDPNRIQQLLENLVENAVKYSPDGGPVWVRLWRDGAWNHLTVTDHGIGIPTEDLGNVFERFNRGSNVDDRRFAGMGLGLFICRGIAEQHGGRIWVEAADHAGSRNGAGAPTGGSTFHVVLPAVSPGSAAAAPAGSGVAAGG